MVGPVRVSRSWGVAGSCDGRGVLGHVGGHVLDHVMGWGVAGHVMEGGCWITCGIMCWVM